MCGPEFSDLETAIWQRYQGNDVMVLGLNPDGPLNADLDAFVTAFGITFPLLVEAASVRTVYSQPGGISPFPLDYIIDQEGQIAYINTEYDPDAMTAKIDELIASMSSVEDQIQPAQLRLSVSPNPFNPRTRIDFEMPSAGLASLTVLDAQGRIVQRLLVDESLGAGRHQVIWDGSDLTGRGVASGVYFLQLAANGFVGTQKMTLVR